jgi:SAM-dependent methyltransferase
VTVSLGIRPIGASGRPDLGTRNTASDRDGPYDTRANGPPMVRGLMALGAGQKPIQLGAASSPTTCTLLPQCALPSGGRPGCCTSPRFPCRAYDRSTVSGTQANHYAETLRAFGLGDGDLMAWRASCLPDEAFNDWLTNRVARRPSGTRARKVYGAEDIHNFARRAILDALALGPGDHLLEVGCGGGLLLRDALGTGTHATGLDHSEDMVQLARGHAPGAEVVLATAETLPFADGTFHAVAMSIVFFFLDDPVGVLRECRRALRHGGRLAIYTTAPELRGTPAAPEPIASLGHFYANEELAELARRAELRDVTVHNEHGGQLLTGRA